MTGKGNSLSLELLSSFRVCRWEDDEGRLCSSHKKLPPGGEVGGRQREAENLEPSGEDSGGAALPELEKTSLSSREDNQDPEV